MNEFFATPLAWRQRAVRPNIAHTFEWAPGTPERPADGAPINVIFTCSLQPGNGFSSNGKWDDSIKTKAIVNQVNPNQD